MNDQSPNSSPEPTATPIPAAAPAPVPVPTAAAPGHALPSTAPGAPVFLLPLKFDPAKETWAEWVRRLVPILRANIEKSFREHATAELAAIPDLQARIDRVADDLQSGKRRYRFIETETLATLLELDLDDTGDWTRTFLAREAKLDESGSAHPCAENLGLLAGRIPDERFALLSAQAEAILGQDSETGPDLELSPAEREQLQEAYAEANPGESEVTLARTALRSRSEFDLEFEVAIGDGGEAFQAWSPYDLAQGGGFDITDYVPVD